jgi:acetylornithine deacetylase/succinyl-diaminopimelate desuccinylase-like protein
VTVDVEPIRQWLAARRPALVDRLVNWVRIPSVDGLASSSADLNRSAQWLAGELRDTGFPRVAVWPAGDAPAVWAHWPGPIGAPRVLVYSHHDVRAVNAEDWTVCAPFEPVERDDRVYGRGASDAKGQVLAHLAGINALLACSGALPVSLTMLIEGEEETGSPHLADLLGQHRAEVAADLVVLSDTMTWSADRPAVCLGARGMVKAALEIGGPAREVHSAAVSGAAPNPVTELVRLLALLHDDGGRVALPGFYDDVREPSPEERAALVALTANARDWAERSGTRSDVGEDGWSVGERLYLRPAAEVLSIVAGDAEAPTRGVLPPSARAELQLSLVPDQDPDDVARTLRQWLAANVHDAFGWSLSVYDRLNQPPYATPRDHPALRACTESMAAAWGCDPGWMRNAGGGPSALLSERAGAPVLLFGTGLPEDNWHGPDESAHVPTLLRGAATMALFWSALARALTSRR